MATWPGHLTGGQLAARPEVSLAMEPRRRRLVARRESRRLGNGGRGSLGTMEMAS